MRRRVLIAFDGKAWYVRRVRMVEHSTIGRDMKIYYCDLPLGGQCQSVDEAVAIARRFLRQRRTRKRARA
jgi:hypothetical protein